MRSADIGNQEGENSMISRRRFIAISGAACLSGVPTQAAKWSGTAMGARAFIELRGDPDAANLALAAAKDTLTRLEGQFSLYDTRSAITQLNRSGKLEMSPEFAALKHAVDIAHQETEGLFDPTIQSLWQALATIPSTDTTQALDLVGWEMVKEVGTAVSFARSGMAITLNGIAQGFVTDRVRSVLNAHGFKETIVNIGEYHVGAVPAKIGIADAKGNLISTRVVQNSAIATSSPNALMLTPDTGHILHPLLEPTAPRWDTVSVHAENACFADAYSTALALQSGTSLAKKLVRRALVHHVILKSTDGQIIRV